jgi:hypothetical protein
MITIWATLKSFFKKTAKSLITLRIIKKNTPNTTLQLLRGSNQALALDKNKQTNKSTSKLCPFPFGH